MKPTQNVIKEGKEQDWKDGEIRHETCVYGYLVGGESRERSVFGRMQVEQIVLPACGWHTKNLADAPEWIKRRASGLVEFHTDCFNCPAHKSLD